MDQSTETPLLNESTDVGGQDIGVVAVEGRYEGFLRFLTELLNELQEDDFPDHDPPAEGNGTGQLPPEPSDEAVSGTEDDDIAESFEEESARMPVDGRFDPPSNPQGLLQWIGRQRLLCIAFVVFFWSFVCLIMSFGVPELGTTWIGLGCSLLLQPNRFFVESINVEQSPVTNLGPVLYGFNNKPPLDVITSWTDTHHASLQSKMQKDWIYVLNEGSQINISFNVPSSSPLFLTIARGSDGYSQWLYDRTFPNTTLSWNAIHGNGLIQQNIIRSGSYHIAVGNLNPEVEEVQLNITTRAFVYNTTEAYYTCTLAQGQCVIPMLFLQPNHAVLTTPSLKQGTSEGEWHVKLTYGPRWSVYFGGLGTTLSPFSQQKLTCL